MLKPDSVLIQEIKVVPSKSKIMDMVAIRHNSGNEQRTTLILLCEDGSLKIYMANMEQTGMSKNNLLMYNVLKTCQFDGFCVYNSNKKEPVNLHLEIY